MLRLAVEGVFGGFSLLGLCVAVLGGASPGILFVFWLVGVLLARARQLYLRRFEGGRL